MKVEMNLQDLKKAAAESPKIVSFPEIDEKIRMQVCNTPLYTLTQTEQADDRENAALFSSPVNMNNWDTVTVIRADSLNAAIAAEKTYPGKIDYSLTDDAADGSVYKISGTFRPWQITPGGSGKNVWFEIVFDDGTFEAGGNTFRLKETSAVISVELAYFPRPEAQAKNGEYKLTVKTSGEENRQDCVSVLNVDTKGSVPLLMESVFSSVLVSWLNSEETLALFQPLFATVVIDNGSSGDFSWLKPTYMSYAYRDDPDLGQALFGVLCMTNGRDGSEGIRQLPLVSMKGDQSLIYLINREIFVKYQYLQGLPLAIEGTTADNYKLGGDNLSVSAEDIPLEGVKYGALTYHPEMKSFHIFFDESRVRTVLQIDVNISPGIDVHSYVETEHVFALGYNEKGEPAMIYKNVGEPMVRNETELGIGVIITEVVADIIIAVASTMIVEALEKVVARVLVAAAAIIVAAVVAFVIHEIIEGIVADGTLDKLPSVTPMVQAGTDPVKWPFLDSGEFEVKEISYSGAFIFAGKAK